MPYKQHLLIILFTVFLCCTRLVFGQEIPPKDTPIIPLVEAEQEQKNDSLSSNMPVIDQINERATDTIQVDSIIPPKEAFTDIVEYFGEQYVYLDKKANKVYMYDKAYIIYGDVRIDAGLIVLDYNTNEVYAKGIDSAGTYSQRPVFKQGANIVEPDSIKYNYNSEKALVHNSRGEEQSFRYIAKTTKKVNDSVIYLSNVKFTTSKNIDNPEYYFFTRRAKFVPKKKIITGVTNMYIADVPTPIGLPFAFLPRRTERDSLVGPWLH